MSGHTEGPWKCVPHAVYPGMLVIEGPESSITIITSAIDIDFKGFCSRTSDAHLIAAAPDLLGALSEMLVNYADVLPGESEKIDQARAAIAKAKGEV